MSIPARCNKCRARRNLSKRPEAYARPPRCHLVGCTGEMRVDAYRLRKGPYDRAPVCCDPFCQWRPANPKRWREPHHRIDTEGCSGYDDYKLTRSWVGNHNQVTTEEVPF